MTLWHIVALLTTGSTLVIAGTPTLGNGEQVSQVKVFLARHNNRRTRPVKQPAVLNRHPNSPGYRPPSESGAWYVSERERERVRERERDRERER